MFEETLARGSKDILAALGRSDILRGAYLAGGTAASANIIHIQKSLVFFNDAEPEKMPKMLKEATWEEIKRYFEREIKKTASF